MQQSILDQIEIYIKDSINDYYHQTNEKPINIFDQFIQRCQLYYDQPAHSIGEIKLKMNKKLKGDIFEHFCLKYCQTCLQFKNVWLLSDVPPEILTSLNLRSHDLGIDLIAQDHHNKFYAIQAKYRKRNYKYKQYTALTWKQLSTFHALTSRTGPYVKHIIITNADYCRQFGRKTKKDKSICYKSLRNIRLDQWQTMAGMNTYKLSDVDNFNDNDNDDIDDLNDIEDMNKEFKLTFNQKKEFPNNVDNVDNVVKNQSRLDELRQKRLAFFAKDK